MVRFELAVARSVDEARALLAEKRGSVFKAGGIDLLDRLKEHLVEPPRVVDLRSIPGFSEIATDAGGVRIGAGATLATIAAHPAIRAGWPALAEACAAAASPQIRNVATIGGNVLQRPRCWYYRLESYKCLKKGGDVCFAIQGENRYHTILGTGPVYAPHPSSAAVALAAYRATYLVEGDKGPRAIPAEEFFTLPDKDPARENVLAPTDVLVAVQLPAQGAAKSAFAEIRERAAFDWPLVSAAISLRIEGGKISEARVALGHVATIPWRSTAAETALHNLPPGPEAAEAAGRAAVIGAKPLTDNAYKIDLTSALVRRLVTSLS
jgi:xanthine dehydrogenase YagS FAD-binding subunit